MRTETRGQSPFNDANLLAALACYPVDDGHYSQADGLALAEYYAFYGLNFAAAEATMGIVGVAGERVAAQTFGQLIAIMDDGPWSVMVMTTLVCTGT